MKRNRIITPFILLLTLSLFAGLTSFLPAFLETTIWLSTALFILINDTNTLRNKSLFLILLFYSISLLYTTLGYGHINENNYRGAISSFLSIISFLIISTRIKTLTERQLSFTISISLFFAGISIIGTTYVGYLNPAALRTYGGSLQTEFNIIAAQYYKSLGMMDYALAHGMSTVASYLCIIGFKIENRYKKALAFILLLLLLRIFFVMTITTALIISSLTISILIPFFFFKGNMVKLTIYATIILLLTFSYGLYSSINEVISQSENSTIAQKFNDVFLSLQTGKSEGQVSGRSELYNASINTFLENPLFGLGKDDESRIQIGQHSLFFDYLAFYGIFSLIFFYSWWAEIKKLKKILDGKLWNLYLISLIPIPVLVITKSAMPITSYFFMTVIVVQILFLYLSKLKKKEIFKKDSLITN